MSPTWATVGNARLYLYASEPHGRPHVDVRGPDWQVKIALDDLEVLATRGRPHRRTLRRVLDLLRDHQEAAIQAYHETAAHRFPGTLDPQEDRP